VDGRLVAVACSFFVGERFEDIGVVTESTHRGLGLSTACAAALCGDIRSRGRRPSWTTSTDNRPSLRVADKLGFVVQRHDRLLLVAEETGHMTIVVNVRANASIPARRTDSFDDLDVLS
jgi:predicted GNAT family acetyltransferase